MAGEHVLVVEDDAALRRVLADNLEFDGYAVTTAADGEVGLARALDRPPDLLVLDIMLPKVNGYEICRHLRSAGLEMPILMLTAKGQETDIVLGLELGADDYITKPFSMRELLARVRAFLRRRSAEKQRVHAFGEFELDGGSRRLTRDGAEVELTPKEFGLLWLLATHGGRAMSRDEIIRRVWGPSVFVTGRSVDRCVNTLRKKIEPDPGRPTYIQTVREVGYRFEDGGSGN